MRAIAFRKKELHEERDTLNAYAVYKTRDDAISAGKRVSGVVFCKKHLRADLADGSVRVRFKFNQVEISKKDNLRRKPTV
jgi:hypothetical protein